MLLRLVILGTFLAGIAIMSDAQEMGIIGEVKEDGLPVVYKFVDEFPSPRIREKYTWVAVISWGYDGSAQNGMPPADATQSMVSLEHVIDSSLVDKGLSLHAYSRTGNNLKELVYYISNRDEFMDAFNTTLASHPRYPIEINFYEDPQWQDFQVILDLFSLNG